MSFDAQQNSGYGGAPLLLFRFYAGTRQWLYTNLKTRVLIGSEEYRPLAISMDRTAQSAQELPPGIEITIPSSDPLAIEFKPFLPPEPIAFEVLTRHRSDGAEEYRTIATGEVGACGFNDDGTATLMCYSLAHNLQRNIPWPVYSTNCNWAVYSAGCGVDRELFKVQGTVDAINGTTISSTAFGAKEDGWFTFGYVVRDSTNDVRWIVKHVGGDITLVSPFIGLQGGESLTAYAGCDGLESTCKDKFNNLPRHAGFPDSPQKNPFADNVFGTGE